MFTLVEFSFMFSAVSQLSAQQGCVSSRLVFDGQSEVKRSSTAVAAENHPELSSPTLARLLLFVLNSALNVLINYKVEEDCERKCVRRFQSEPVSSQAEPQPWQSVSQDPPTSDRNGTT